MNKNPSSIEQLLIGFSPSDAAQIERAMAFVNEAGNDPHNIRPRGQDVAMILMAVHIDLETILAALLSDSRISKRLSEPALKEQFGSTVAALVKDINWLNNLTVYTPEMTNQPNQSETLRRMLLAMTHDVRAVLIKLAYRIQRLRNLSVENEEIRRFIRSRNARYLCAACQSPGHQSI